VTGNVESYFPLSQDTSVAILPSAFLIERFSLGAWWGAEVEYKRAFELNPQYANAHHWYGNYLSIQGRHDEALVEAKRALELAPLNLASSTGRCNAI
jgi:tetratricopeptide (TPR) repeat protein